MPEWLIGSHNGSTTDGQALKYYVSGVRIALSQQHGDYGVKVSINGCGPFGVGSNPTNHPKNNQEDVSGTI